ncbi:MAG: flagellar basal body P-ring protein FlgI [Rubripirellula sp.]|jgi:flagellar basal body P-ring protein FlgI|nr:flagellar basal body P-ring protein FlgI [Rubripirellula sp.]
MCTNPNQLSASRRRVVFQLASIAIALASGTGCNALFPGRFEEAENEAKLRDLMRAPEPPDLIRDGTIIQGLSPLRIEGVGAVNALPGTGGPPDPSVFRDQLLEEMKRHDVIAPNQWLEQEDTALVRVLALIPPGARRGDLIDIRVLAPKESRVTDLHHGWLLDTRLREQRMLQNIIRQSDVLAIGQGSILTRADHEPNADESLRNEGRILSGGRVQVTRKLGLILRPEFQHAKLSKAIADAINRRLFFFDGTTRRGIATAIEDDFIEIEVHPRYRDNVPRMMQVVQAIGIKVEINGRQERLTELAQKLRVPETAADAALQLEALGESAVPTLLEGLESSNQELQFYAAEALGYLDRVESIEPLEKAAREVAAFRYPSLIALQGIEQQLAVDALKRLMDEPSLETRYGAFCSIRRRIDGKPALGGSPLGPLSLYQISSQSTPAIVVSLQEEPEVVLLGDVKSIKMSSFLMLPGGIMIKPDPKHPDELLRISRFQAGEQDRRVVVSSSVDDVIAGMVQVGGCYGDIINMLRAAKDQGFLVDQLAINPLPTPVRTYYRDDPENQNVDQQEVTLDSLN